MKKNIILGVTAVSYTHLRGGRFGIAVFRGRGLHSELSGPICI